MKFFLNIKAQFNLARKCETRVGFHVKSCVFVSTHLAAGGRPAYVGIAIEDSERNHE